jgi:hypothetical protein
MPRPKYFLPGDPVQCFANLAAEHPNLPGEPYSPETAKPEAPFLTDPFDILAGEGAGRYPPNSKEGVSFDVK